MVDDTSPWSAFRSRCLEPLEAQQKPIVDGLVENLETNPAFELREGSRVFVSPAMDWGIIIGGYEHKKAWYQSVSLARPLGVEDQDLLDSLRIWSRSLEQKGKYMTGQNRLKGSFSCRSTGWRKPTLEIYSFPPRKTSSRYILLWETYT